MYTLYNIHVVYHLCEREKEITPKKLSKQVLRPLKCSSNKNRDNNKQMQHQHQQQQKATNKTTRQQNTKSKQQ